MKNRILLMLLVLNFTLYAQISTNETPTGLTLGGGESFTGTTANTKLISKPNINLLLSETLNISQNVVSGNTDNQQASKTIKATNIISPNAKAVYDAGDVVILKPGFHAKSGSSFRAFIEGCKNQNNINATSNAFFEYDYVPTSENNHDLEELNFETDNALTIYPNPSDDGIFNIRSTIKIVSYLVVDFVGNPVFKYKDNKDISRIDLSKYPKGFYILKIQTENGKRIDYKLIKQ